MALQFHPDKNKAPGATEAFKAIGKAFAILSDTQKRKHYDNYGPDSFDNNVESPRESTRHHRSAYTTSHQYYWNEEDFSADELFNLFFGGNYASTNHRSRHNAHHHRMPNGQANFVFSSSVYTFT